MNLLKIGNITINLDTVTHWVEFPKSEYTKSQKGVPPSGSPYTPFFEQSDDPVVVIHHIGPNSPFVLNPNLSRAFLAYVRSTHAYGEVQLEKTEGAAAGS
jgi:hypothetical protein